MLSKPKANWKSVKYFIEYYDLSRAHAYKLLKLPGFPCIKTGEKSLKVNMSETDKWFQDYFGR